MRSESGPTPVLEDDDGTIGNPIEVARPAAPPRGTRDGRRPARGPGGAASLDRAKEQGLLVLGNDVGDRRFPVAGLRMERSAADQLVWEAYSVYCTGIGRPLIWVGVVFTATSSSPIAGRDAWGDPAADVHLQVGCDRVLDEAAIHRIRSLPGRCMSLPAAIPAGSVHLRVGLNEALDVARSLLAIATEIAHGGPGRVTGRRRPGPSRPEGDEVLRRPLEGLGRMPEIGSARHAGGG